MTDLTDDERHRTWAGVAKVPRRLRGGMNVTLGEYLRQFIEHYPVDRISTDGNERLRAVSNL